MNDYYEISVLGEGKDGNISSYILAFAWSFFEMRICMGSDFRDLHLYATCLKLDFIRDCMVFGLSIVFHNETTFDIPVYFLWHRLCPRHGLTMLNL